MGVMECLELPSLRIRGLRGPPRVQYTILIRCTLELTSCGALELATLSSDHIPHALYPFGLLHST